MEQSSYLIERYDTKKNDNNHTPIFFHSVSFHSVSFRFGMKNCWPSLQAVFRLQNSNLSYGLFHFCDLFRAFTRKFYFSLLIFLSLAKTKKSGTQTKKRLPSKKVSPSSSPSSSSSAQQPGRIVVVLTIYVR